MPYAPIFMTQISEAEMEKLVHLCRIACTAEERETLKGHLLKMLTYVEQLKEIDTEHAPPCQHVLATHQNVLREDVPGDCLERERYLANAPSHVGGLIRVPSVMKES